MNKIETAAAIAAVALLTSCAVPRQPADSRGVSFPERSASYLEEGSVVNPADVRLIQPGASKDQVRLKLGNPHFSEGLFAVDQWNYILGLPSATGSGLLSCQYQVQFDKQHKVKATYWNTDECSAAAAAPDDVAATGSAVPAEYGPIGEIQTWSEDGLFTFGRSGLGDLDASGRKDLEQLAERVAKQEAQVQNVTIYGFADRIGSAGGNYDLSLARAHTVADLLVAKGVDSKLIEVVAKGRFESTTECKSGTSKAALIDCLQPDRRVLVTVRIRTAEAAAN